MPKYLITWNIGYGDNTEVIEAASEEKAQKEAYERWREDAESNSDYSAKLLTPELAEEYGEEF